MELMVEATPKRVFGNAHTYHINSISLNSDQETFLSADDLRINLWHTEVTDQSFSTFFFLDEMKQRFKKSGLFD
jgi:serine/threonine-protein phosphatase 2A regulatory subunit B